MITGYYINRAGAADRRRHMEAELRRVGLQTHYRRAEAIELDVPDHESSMRGSHGLWANWRAALTETEFELHLKDKGLLSEVPTPITNLSAYAQRNPVRVTGKPLSETIIEERG